MALARCCSGVSGAVDEEKIFNVVLCEWRVGRLGLLAGWLRGYKLELRARRHVRVACLARGGLYVSLASVLSMEVTPFVRRPIFVRRPL